MRFALNTSFPLTSLILRMLLILQLGLRVALRQRPTTKLFVLVSRETVSTFEKLPGVESELKVAFENAVAAVTAATVITTFEQNVRLTSSRLQSGVHTRAAVQGTAHCYRG